MPTLKIREVGAMDPTAFSEFGLIESAFVTEADDRTPETFSIAHDPFVVHAPPPGAVDV